MKRTLINETKVLSVYIQEKEDLKWGKFSAVLKWLGCDLIVTYQRF